MQMIPSPRCNHILIGVINGRFVCTKAENGLVLGSQTQGCFLIIISPHLPMYTVHVQMYLQSSCPRIGTVPSTPEHGGVGNDTIQCLFLVLILLVLPYSLIISMLNIHQFKLSIIRHHLNSSSTVEMDGIFRSSVFWEAHLAQLI